MSKRKDHANRNDAVGGAPIGADDKGLPLWSTDEEVVSGRSWSLILVFIFVPLMALVVLGVVVFALFSHVFGTTPTP